MPRFANLRQLPALLFGGATSDRAVFGSPAGWTGLTSLSALVLTRCDSLTSARGLVAKTSSGLTEGYRLDMSGTTGNLRFQAKYVTTNVNYVVSDTPVVPARWRWYAVVFDSVNAPMVHIYSGNRGTALRESTYGTATDGVGGYTIDTNANNLTFGNNGSTTNAWPGAISVVGFWGEVKTLAYLDMVRDALDYEPFLDLPPALVYAALGAEGSGALNRAQPGSTNGTITGTTRTAGPYVTHRRRIKGARAVVAPATKLLMVVQPQNTVVGQTMATITVEATDASGVRDTNYTTNVVLGWGTNGNNAPSPGGTLTRAMVAGVVSFNDIVVNTLQTNATFDFTSGSITHVVSSTFSITVPASTSTPDLFGEGSLIL